MEVVVVDDGSDDGTDAIIEQDRGLLESQGIALHLRFLEVNSGPAAARNAGLQIPRGQLIAFLASDDLWQRDFVLTLVELLERYPACGVAFSGHFSIDGDDEVSVSARPDLR